MAQQGLTEEQKKQINDTIKQMVADGASDEEIIAYRDGAVKSSPVQDQTDAPVQDLESTDLASEEPSSESPLDDEQKDFINQGIRLLVEKGASDEQILAYKNLQMQKAMNGEELSDDEEVESIDEMIYNQYNDFVDITDEEKTDIEADYIANKEEQYEELADLSEEDQKKALGSKAEWDRFKRYQKDGEVKPTDMDLAQDMLSQRQLKSNRFLQDLPASDRESVLKYLGTEKTEKRGELDNLKFVLGKKDEELNAMANDFTALKESLEIAHKKGEKLTPEAMQAYTEAKDALLIKMSERQYVYEDFMKVNEDAMNADLAIDAFGRNYSGLTNFFTKEGPKTFAKLGYGMLEAIVGRPGERGKAEEDWTPVERAVFAAQDALGRQDEDGTQSKIKEALLDSVAYFNSESEQYSPYHISAKDIQSVDDFIGYAEQTAVENATPLMLAAAAPGAAPVLFFGLGYGEKKVEYALNEREAAEELPKLRESLAGASEDEAIFIKEKIAQYEDIVNQSEVDKELAAIGYGASEAIFESLTTLRLIKNLGKPMRYIPKTKIRPAIKNRLLKKAAYHSQEPLMEVAGESLTTISQNLLDISIDGSDKSVIEGIEDAALSALLISGGFKAASVSKGAYGSALNAARNRAEREQLLGNATRISEINRELSENKNLSESDKAILMKDRSKLYKDSSIIADEAIAKMDKMSLDEVKEMFEYEKQLRNLNSDLTNVENSENMSEKIKESYRANLQAEINNVLTQKEDFLAKQEGKKEDDVVDRESELDDEGLEKLRKMMGVQSTPEVIQSKEEILDTEIKDNLESSENLYQDSYDNFGVSILPAPGKARANTENSRIPMTKDGDTFSKGDFIKNVTSGTMTKQEANAAKKAITAQAKAAGFVPKVRILENNDGLFEVTGTIESAKRKQKLSNQAAAEVKAQQEEETTKTEEAKPERKASDAALEYAQAETKDTGKGAYEGTAPVDQGGDVFYEGLSDPKQFKKAGVYATLGKLRKAGYPDARYELSDQGLTILPGELDADTKTDELQIKPENANISIDRVKAADVAAEDGATLNLDGTEYNDGGLVVPVASKNLKVSELSPEAIQDFVNEHQSKIGNAGIVKAGIYKFPNSDNASIDLNIVVPKENREAALEVGKYLGQESLFDLDTFENVKTGETGASPKNLTDKQFKDTANALSRGLVPSFISGKALPIDADALNQHDAPLQGAPEDGPQRDDFQYKDTNVLTPEDLKELGIKESDIFNKAEEGQVYVKVPFDKKGAVVDADSSIGGKGGFASSGDAREAISTAGKPMSARDGMRLAESLYEGGVKIGEFFGVDIKEFAKKAGSIIPAFSKVQYKSTGNIIDSKSFDKIKNDYDKLAGYKGASNKLDNDFRITVENKLNLDEKTGRGPHDAPPPGARREDVDLGAVTDRAGQISKERGIFAYLSKLSGYEATDPNIILGSQQKAKETVARKEATPEYKELVDAYNKINAAVKAAVAMRGKSPISKEHARLAEIIKGLRPYINMNNAILDQQEKIDVAENKIEIDSDAVRAAKTKITQLSKGINEAIASEEVSNFIREGLALELPSTGFVPDSVFQESIEGDAKSTEKSIAKERGVTLGRFDKKLEQKDVDKALKSDLQSSLAQKDLATLFELLNNFTTRIANKKFDARNEPDVLSAARVASYETIANMKEGATIDDVISDAYNRTRDNVRKAKREGVAGRYISLPHNLAVKNRMFRKATSKLEERGWTPTDEEIATEINRVNKKQTWTAEDVYEHRLLVHEAENTFFESGVAPVQNADNTLTFFSLDDLTGSRKLGIRFNSVSENIFGKDKLNEIDEEVSDILSDPDIIDDPADADKYDRRKVDSALLKANKAKSNLVKQLILDELKFEGLGANKQIIDQISDLMVRRKDPFIRTAAPSVGTKVYDDLGATTEKKSTDKKGVKTKITRAVEKVNLWDEVFSPEAKRRNPNGPRLWLDKIANWLANAAEARAMRLDYGGQVYEPGQAPIDEFQYLESSNFYGQENAKKPFSVKKRDNPGRTLGEIWNAEKPSSLKGKEFVEVITGENPESYKQLRHLARQEGWNMYAHPQNTGLVIMTARGTKLFDVAYFGARPDGMAFQEDPRRYADRSVRNGDKIVYPNLNREHFKNTLDFAVRRAGNARWSELTRIDQLSEKDAQWIEDYLAEKGITRANGKLKVITDRGTHAGAIPKKRMRISNTAIDELSYYGNKATNQNVKAIAAITDYLAGKFKGKMEFSYKPADIQATVDRINRDRAARGLKLIDKSKLQGVRTYDGKIIVNPETAGLDTPFHEVGHSWLKEFKKKFENVYAKAEALAKKSDLYKTLRNNPIYETYSEQQYLEEVMAHLIGEAGVTAFKKKIEQTRWQNFVNKVKAFAADILGVSPSALDKMTLNDFVQFAATDIVEGGSISDVFNNDEFQSYSDKVNNETKLDEEVDEAADRLAEKEEKRGRIRRFFNNPLAALIPPASDDYHGLVSKLKGIVDGPLVTKVTDAFVKNHHAYVEASQQARVASKDNISKLEKSLGLKMDQGGIPYKGNKLSVAQAIQAIVDGHTGPALDKFASKKAVRDYIEDMTGRGILKPSKGDKSYDTASPQGDIVGFVINDLYKSHFREFNQTKDAVFTDKVMSKIRRDRGTGYHDALKKALQKMSTGKAGAGISDRTTQKWNDWLLGSVGVTMFLNGRSAALQLLSVANYGFAAKNPGMFVAKMMSPATFAKAKELYSSPYLKERRARAGFDVNAAEMVELLNNSKSFSEFTKKALNFGFKATSFVDSVAISFGGAAFIEAQTRAGVSEKDAIAQWKEQTEEAQQSSRPDRTSKWQTDSVSKFVLAFANTPQQYFRLGQKAARTLVDSNATAREKTAAVARIGWYMVVQNMIFTMAQAAGLGMFGDDEKEAQDQYSSMASSILRGMGLYGAIIDAAKDVFIDAYKQSGKKNPDYVNSALKATKISPPLNRKINDLMAIGRAYEYDDPNKEAVAISRVGALANLPTDWGYKKYTAAMDIWEDKFAAWQDLLRVVGWSEYQLDAREDGEDFDPFKDVSFDDIDFNDIDIDGLEDLDFFDE